VPPAGGAAPSPQGSRAGRPFLGRAAGRRPQGPIKELLLGPPLATSRLTRERLDKLVALPVFSSDAISSTCTQSICRCCSPRGRLARGWPRGSESSWTRMVME
jgi:hypothetical protein